EIPESDWSRTPRSGAVRPARARHTISSPLRRAIAAPLAPVRVFARSAIRLMAGSRSTSAGNDTGTAAAGRIAGWVERLTWLLPGASEAKDTGRGFSITGTVRMGPGGNRAGTAR